jgi:transposase-like protein
VAAKIGCSAETLRSWVQQAERDRAERSGLTTSEREELKALQLENRELKKANEILRLA